MSDEAERDVAQRLDRELDPDELVGESEHSVRSSGQRGYAEDDEAETEDEAEGVSNAPEDGLSIDADELGEKYLETATESSKGPRKGR